MKKNASLIITILFLSIISFMSNAQDITFNKSEFNGGTNISCNGAADGWIHLVVVGGQPPYLYNWSNGSFSQNQSGLTAGDYTVVVTDANMQTTSADIELFQPKPIELKFATSEYEGGYNVSKQGGSDGSVEANCTGGIAPYSFLWSTGSIENKIFELTASTYSVSLVDMNNCASTGTVNLTEPTQLSIASLNSPLHHGYNISCFGGNDGVIDLSVTGGVPPYSYQWSNGKFQEDLTELTKGIYWVIVRDANKNAVAQQILLTEPPVLNISSVTKSYYSGDYNVSCSDCSNGSISATVIGGVQPYAYHWSNNQSQNPVQNLSAGEYSLYVSDNNGCSSKEVRTNLIAPERDDWTLNGNALLNHNGAYMGTSDSIDLVFKTNNIERYRVTKDGNIGISTSTIPTGYKLAVNGKIICEELKVKLHTAWPDYVFSDTFNLQSIEEMKEFINKNHHLPGIPSANEIAATDILVSDLMHRLLEKIEILSLYIIQQQDQINQLSSGGK